MFGFGFDRMLDKLDSIKTPAQILGANYYDHWDYTDAATLSVTGTYINSCTSKGINGVVMASTGTERPKVLAGQINGYQVADFDGVNDFAQVAASTGMYNFLHNGAGGTVIIISRVNDANPDNNQILMSNNDSNQLNVGFGIAFDDRSSSSRNNIVFVVVTRGVGNAVVSNLTANGVFPTQQYNNLLAIFDADNAIAANRSELSFNNGAFVKNNVITNAPSGANAYNNLTIGKQSTTNVAYFKGQFVEVLIANTIITPQQELDLKNYYTFKYGTFPIL